jgi:bifunctional non-homologous end joining protein LigD
VLEAVRALGRDLQLDGELIALDERGYSDFNALQHALMAGTTGTLRYMVFDLPGCDGEDLASFAAAGAQATPAGAGWQRHGRQGRRPWLVYSEHIDGHGPQVFGAARRHGVEGIVSKRGAVEVRQRPLARLAEDQSAGDARIRGRGFTEPKGSRSGFGALLLAKREQDRLVYCRPRRFRLQRRAAARPAQADCWQSNATHRRSACRRIRGWTARCTGSSHNCSGKCCSAVGARKALLRQALVPPTARRPHRRCDVGATGDVLPKLTSPERVVYPPTKGGSAKITKQQVFDYYAAAGAAPARGHGGRLLSIVRCPNGIEGQHFFQKHLGKGFRRRHP